MRKLFGLLCLVLYKFSVETGFWFILGLDTETYIVDFSMLKYVNGMIWIIVLFSILDFKKKKVSQFMCLFKLLFEMIPITVVYALSNENAIYYNILCASFGLCEVICNTNIATRNVERSKMVLFLFLVTGPILFGVIGIIILKNKMPSLLALNIYNVYKLRAQKSFIINKYVNYIFQWCIYVIIPYKMTNTILNKNYCKTLFWSGCVVLLYLYTGHKTYLFSIPLILVIAVWSKRKAFMEEFVVCFSLAHIVLISGAFINKIFMKIYGLIGRRVLIVPANLKFKYFDFFSSNPHTGIYGLFPTWLIPVDAPYDQKIGNIISEIYFNKPEMNSNTGFLAEGYMRFGLLGIPTTLILFACILKLMDNLQHRTSFSFVVGVCIYLVFDLSDGGIWNVLFIGPWMFMIVFLILYYPCTFRRKKDLDKRSFLYNSSIGNSEKEG